MSTSAPQAPCEHAQMCTPSVGPSTGAVRVPGIGKGALLRLEGPHGGRLGAEPSRRPLSHCGHGALSCRPRR